MSGDALPHPSPGIAPHADYDTHAKRAGHTIMDGLACAKKIGLARPQVGRPTRSHENYVARRGRANVESYLTQYVARAALNGF